MFTLSPTLELNMGHIHARRNLTWLTKLSYLLQGTCCCNPPATSHCTTTTTLFPQSSLGHWTDICHWSNITHRLFWSPGITSYFNSFTLACLTLINSSSLVSCPRGHFRVLAAYESALDCLGEPAATLEETRVWGTNLNSCLWLASHALLPKVWVKGITKIRRHRIHQ